MSKKTINERVDGLNPGQVSQYVEKYYLVLDKLASVREGVTNIELKLEKSKVKMLQYKDGLARLLDHQNTYETNKEIVENFETLLQQKAATMAQKNIADKEVQDSRKTVLDLYKSVGSLEEKHKQVTQQWEEYTNLEEEYATADLFMRCMHPNGISYDVIKKRLPVINSEISKILTNIVDFDISFENDEKKLDILIKHPKHDPRPIEMGSGAEKTIAAMAIRLALLNVSTLPKGDIFVLDEPGTALDAENMEGFIRILEMIKSQFKTVFLISHLDSLKDIVDGEVLIDKVDGRAYVNE